MVHLVQIFGIIELSNYYYPLESIGDICWNCQRSNRGVLSLNIPIHHKIKKNDSWKRGDRAIRQPCSGFDTSCVTSNNEKNDQIKQDLFDGVTYDRHENSWKLILM